MKVIAVDDERLALDNIITLLTQTLPAAEVTGFTNPAEALYYLSEHPIDIAFLDIELGKISGMELAKKCKKLSPQVNIIFVTGYSQYTMDAFKIHASGYLLKPVRASDLRAEVANLRYPLPPPSARRVRIQTFGNFEIFVDERPLKLLQAKCKECLAYLVDRKGARVTMAEIAAILWEDKPYDRKTQNNLHRVIFDMMKGLKEVGAQDIVIRSRRELAIDPTMIDCDYFRAIGGEGFLKNAFRGEYMSNYAWAELTLGILMQKK